MLGLFGTLNLATRSLATQQAGTEVAGHNLANVSNPAYARQRMRIETSVTMLSELGPQGTGADGVEIERLRNAIQAVLQRAIQLNGSSLGHSSVQNYLRHNGELGGFQDEHKVYQRAGEACPQCGQKIERMVLAQRSTHFCTVCQK